MGDGPAAGAERGGAPPRGVVHPGPRRCAAHGLHANGGGRYVVFAGGPKTISSESYSCPVVSTLTDIRPNSAARWSVAATVESPARLVREQFATQFDRVASRGGGQVSLPSGEMKIDTIDS